MKYVILLALLTCVPTVYSVVPNTEFYEDCEQRILELRSEMSSIQSLLVRMDHDKDEYVSFKKLEINYMEEIKLIEDRIRLYRGLEESNLIMYLNSNGSL